MTTTTDALKITSEGTDRPIAATIEVVCLLPKDPDDTAVAAFRRAVDVKAFELHVAKIMLALQSAAETETEHDIEETAA